MRVLRAGSVATVRMGADTEVAVADLEAGAGPAPRGEGVRPPAPPLLLLPLYP
jgi:hypothetical protein